MPPTAFAALQSAEKRRHVLQVTPPASGKSSDPWWLDIASPVPGLAERFRLEQGRLIFNELLQGYIKCGGSGPTTALGSPIQGTCAYLFTHIHTSVDHGVYICCELETCLLGLTPV